jgi:hypothetical protein
MLPPHRSVFRSRKANVMSKNINRTQQQTADQALVDGLEKHQATLTSLTLGGTTLETADLIGILQARIDARSGAVSTRAAWLTNVKADHDQRAKTKAVVAGLRQALHVWFAGSIDALADFGLRPRKAPVMTPEQKQTAAAKAKATRAARHTMGSQQKKSVKGDVTGIAVTPITPAHPAAATGSPATPAPAGAAPSLGAVSPTAARPTG